MQANEVDIIGVQWQDERKGLRWVTCRDIHGNEHVFITDNPDVREGDIWEWQPPKVVRLRWRAGASG